jgi:hypothetical protein
MRGSQLILKPSKFRMKPFIRNMNRFIRILKPIKIDMNHFIRAMKRSEIN